MAYVVAAALKVKKKYVSEFLRRVKRHAQNSIAREPGCVSFEVSVDKDDPRRFMFYEVYVDEAAFEAHNDAPHMKRHMAAVGHMVDGKVEMFGLWDRIAAPNK